MKTPFYKTLLKSLFIFSARLLCPWVNTPFLNVPTNPQRQTFLTSSISNIDELPKPIYVPESYDQPPSDLIEVTSKLGTDTYNDFLWFILMAMILEALTMIFSLVRRYLNKSPIGPQNPHKSHELSSGISNCECNVYQAKSSRIKSFIKYILKMMLLYSICYFLYSMVLAAFSFVFYAYIPNQELSTQQRAPLNELTPRSLEGSDQIILDSGDNGGSRLLASLSAADAQILFQTQVAIDSIIISNDENTAFIVTSFAYAENYTLQILDISTRSSPKFLGNLPLVSVPCSLVLSADGKTIFMGISNILEVIDVSNLTFPFLVASYTFENPDPTATELIISIFLSSDGRFLFLSSTIYNPITVSEYYLIRVINVTDIASPQPMSILLNVTDPLILNVYQESLYVQTNEDLLIYDVSDIQAPALISNTSLIINGTIQSLAFAPDYLTAYVGIDGPVNGISGGYLQILNLSNNNISYIGQETLIIVDNYPQVIIASPDNTHIFVIGGSYLQIFDVSNPRNPIPLASNIATSSSSALMAFAIGNDGQTALLSTNQYFYIMRLNLNVQETQAFRIQNNVLGKVNLTVQDDLYQQLALSPNGSLLYIALANIFENAVLITVNVSNPSSPVVLPSLQLQYQIVQFAISPDNQCLFVASPTSTQISFLIVNISTMQPVYNLTFDNFPSQMTNLEFFAITPDGNIALIVQSLTNFIILNVSNYANPSILKNSSMPEFYINYISFVRNGQAAILAGSLLNDTSDSIPSSVIYIYNMSGPSDPSLLTSFTNMQGYLISMTFSPDENIAFVLTQPASDSAAIDYCTLNIVNISSLSAPELITTMELLNGCAQQPTLPFAVSMMPNGQTLFIPLEDTSNNGMLVSIDVTDPSSPALIDNYPIIGFDMIASPDQRNLYILDSNGLTITTLTPENILFSDTTNFALGSQYTNALTVLTLNSQSTYDARLSNYKFTDVSLYNPSLNPGATVAFVALPNWIMFDKNTGLITFQPNSQSLVGPYSIYGTFSMQIANDTFVGIGPINSTNASIDFLVGLMNSGYVDNQFYLTANFDPTQPLTLMSQYWDYEAQIRSALAEYYLDAMMRVSVTSSLSLTLQEPSSSSPSLMSINTLSLEPLNVVITLQGQNNTQPVFVTTGYSFSASFPGNNSIISMVDSLTDINSALPQFIIFLNGSISCSGNITVTDGLNPPLNQFVPDMSQYFQVSSNPSINTSYLLSQLAKVQPKTGEQFVIQFNSATFTDSTGQQLTLTLQMQDSSLEVPQWLDLKDYTLTGTPPEQLTGRELELILIVSNQYQSNEATFTLDVGISIEYAFKMIATYGGVLITVIGLWIYAYHIYNIFGKRFYRYHKDFIIRAGQEIKSNTLYPIPFAAEPLRESRLIMRYMDKKISSELKTSRKEKIADFFILPSSHNLDRFRLMQAIGEAANDILKTEPTELKLYTSTVASHKELINQLIINEFTVRLLDIQQERPTKLAFEQIKKEIFSLVDLEKVRDGEFCVFSVNKASLYSKLRDYQIKVSPSSDNNNEEQQISVSSIPDSKNIPLESLQPEPEKKKKLESIKTKLVSHSDPGHCPPKPSGVNIELLVSVMEAYAFNNHIIDVDIVDAEIVARQRQPKLRLLATLRRFLKLDLRRIGFSGKALVGYGIKYKVQKQLLIFYGTANENIEDKTLVVQIMNRRGKILREIWVYGVAIEPERGPLVGYPL